MRKSLYSICVLSVFLAACQTSIIPGEKAIAVKNIAIEYYLIADGYADLKKYEIAADYYLKAARHRTYQVQGAYKAARMYALDSKWDKALGVYEKLLRADPKNKNLLEARAYIVFQTGKMRQARKRYEQLIEMIPDDAALLRNYIQVLIGMKDSKRASEYLEKYKTTFSDETKTTEIEEALKKLIESQRGKVESPADPPEEEVSDDTDLM
ncbi:MAG: tetratricopeptide repeat protein [Treponemataceae bacterium]